MVKHIKIKIEWLPTVVITCILRNSITPFLGESCLGNRNPNMAHLNSICRAAALTPTSQNLNIKISVDEKN